MKCKKEIKNKNNKTNKKNEWKKMEVQSISSSRFKHGLKRRIFNRKIQ